MKQGSLCKVNATLESGSQKENFRKLMSHLGNTNLMIQIKKNMFLRFRIFLQINFQKYLKSFEIFFDISLTTTEARPIKIQSQLSPQLPSPSSDSSTPI